MYLRNIFSVHLHTVPGQGVEEMEKIFKYSSAYKKFRLTINHASFVEKYILDKLEIIEESKSFFIKKDLEKILRVLRGKAYLNEEQSNDIMSFAMGRVPSHKEIPKEEPEEEIEQKQAPKIEERESDAWNESSDLDYDMAANDELSIKKTNANLEKTRRYEEIRKMSDNI